MPLINTASQRRKRNLAILEECRRDLSNLGLNFVWDKGEEDACYLEDFDEATQARLRATFPK